MIKFDDAHEVYCGRLLTATVTTGGNVDRATGQIDGRTVFETRGVDSESVLHSLRKIMERESCHAT